MPLEHGTCQVVFCVSWREVILSGNCILLNKVCSFAVLLQCVHHGRNYSKNFVEHVFISNVM